ncbi:hypothetical protein COCMIDRAFT_102892 [Bipolaris oryzae ATCC 44560]|uniref:Uncharacterized protein n=1 Tax=Bipolaris oryzae ATCC 44560 TaxID=930090 RepID=W6ZGN3_COCMI|nr:uncharacterized protein COCMIDRAFT_102892 [Bipolaris oryzae ATCC 44560]EUC42656.1 hypothetical protein COCMIDRAFT_102892 [Bipolaris oryzae ATCC 44560]
MPPILTQSSPEPHESIDAILMLNTCNLPIITPCSATLNPHSFALPNLFHLLTCGHIVTIDDTDRRCAHNCHRTTATTSRPSEFPEPQYTNSADEITFTDTATNIYPDTLYCEVCTGIPFDRYYIMFPPPGPSLLRRCLALSRAIIAATMILPALAVDEILCPVLYVPGHVPHELRCGHRVWCMLERWCGVNCSDCREGRWKGLDAVVCEECVGRGERVYERYW